MRAARMAAFLVIGLAVVSAGATEPDWGGAWTDAGPTSFQLTRFDGGYDPVSGLVYFMGGRLPSTATPDTDGSVWSFNPATGIYTDTGVDLPTPVSNYTMNLLQDGSGTWGFYIFGGRPTGGGVTDVVQVFYPAGGTVAQLPGADDYPGSLTCSSGLSAVHDNKVYVTGGFDPGVSPFHPDETWVFDPTAASGSRWSQIATATLSQPRAYINSAVVDGKIYALGGAYFDGAALINVTRTEVLDTSSPTPTWSDAAVAELPEECSSSRAFGFDAGSLYQDPVDSTPLASKIIMACGWWADENNHVLAYDTVANTWENFPYLITDRRDEAGELVPASSPPAIWLWGGRKDSDDNVLTSVEYFGFDLVPVELMTFTVE